MSGLLEAIRAGDDAALNELTADDVRFHSPVTDYEGRPRVVHLLRTIGGILEELEAEETFHAPSVTVTIASARVEGSSVTAMLREEVDAAGALVDLTLMVRPLEVLMKAVERMGKALNERPLPDS